MTLQRLQVTNKEAFDLYLCSRKSCNLSEVASTMLLDHLPGQRTNEHAFKQAVVLVVLSQMTRV